MLKKPHEITAQAIARFNRYVFGWLAEKHGGECTLNEMRVMNQIICCHLQGKYCYVTALHKKTGIPIPTVSRAVANLQSDGWLSERRDPTDGRKGIISLSPRYLNETFDEFDMSIDLIDNFREHGLSM